MTIVGISTHYKDFLMTAAAGVNPPIYNAETNYIRSAPTYSIVEESNGDVDITYNKGIF